MPGKVNPVMPEMAGQVALQVMGSDQVITTAAAAGQLDLNAFMPVIAHNLLGSLEMLIKTVNLFNEKCVSGIRADRERCRRWLEESHSFITALTPHLGYERSSALVKQSIKENKNLRQLILDSGLLTADNLEAIFTPGELTRPGIAGAKFMMKEGGA